MQKIYAAIIAIMADLAAVPKSQRNEVQRYMYRGIDDLLNALHPLMARHGVFAVPTVLDVAQSERETRSSRVLHTIVAVQYTFYAGDGSSVVATVRGEAMDSGDKSLNKAMSAALKYALIQVFAVPTEDLRDSEEDDYDIDASAPVRHAETHVQPAPPPPPVPPAADPELAAKVAARIRRCHELAALLPADSPLIAELAELESQPPSADLIHRINGLGLRLRAMVDEQKPDPPDNTPPSIPPSRNTSPTTPPTRKSQAAPSSGGAKLTIVQGQAAHAAPNLAARPPSSSVERQDRGRQGNDTTGAQPTIVEPASSSHQQQHGRTPQVLHYQIQKRITRLTELMDVLKVCQTDTPSEKIAEFLQLLAASGRPTPELLARIDEFGRKLRAQVEPLLPVAIERLTPIYRQFVGEFPKRFEPSVECVGGMSLTIASKLSQHLQDLHSMHTIRTAANACSLQEIQQGIEAYERAQQEMTA